VRAVPHRRLAIRTNLWLPSAVTGFVAVILSWITTSLDRVVDRRSIELPGLLAVGNVDDVRAILTTVAGSSITVVSLTASLTLVAITVSASSLGPRQIRSFVRDPYIKWTIAAFVGTFAFSLFVLLRQRAGEPYVQRISTGWLVAFVHHVALGLTPTARMVRVLHEIEESIAAQDDLRPTWWPRPDVLRAMAVHDEARATTVRAKHAGYVQVVEPEELLPVASAAEAIIRVLVKPGDFVTVGQPIALVWGHQPSVQEAIDGAITIFWDRSVRHDPEFGIEVLVEIAIRALSPAVNDTYTGRRAVDWIGEILRMLAARPTGVPVHLDANGLIRVVEVPLRFGEAVTSAFDPIRQSSAGNPVIVLRLLEVCQRLAPHLKTDGQREALVRQVEAIRVAASQLVAVPTDAQAIGGRATMALTALGRHPD
jgi:uncharacterized membrane protein